MKKIKLGVAPTRRSIFSAPDAVKYRNLTVKRLSELGVDYVDITDINEEGLLYNDEDMEKIAEKFKNEKIDGLFLPHCNFGTEYECARLAKKLNVPVLLWGPRDERPDGNGIRLRDSQCGLFATGKVLRRFKIPFTYMCNCRLEDKAFERGIKDFLAVCNVVRSFRNIRIDVTVEAVIDEIEGADSVEIEMYDSNKELITKEKTAKATKGTITVSFTPTKSGNYTFIAKAYRDAEETPNTSVESAPANFLLPLKAPTSFNGRNMGGGDIEIGFAEVPEATGYVVSAVEAEEITDADGKASYKAKDGVEAVELESETNKVKYTGLSLGTWYIFKAFSDGKSGVFLYL